jgi:ribonucleoside-diphosphate reductase alpha chain
MRVKKRNGKTEYFDFKKIEKAVRFACPNEEFVQKFISGFQLNIKDGMTTKELHQLAIQYAGENITADTPQWDGVASKLYLQDMIKEAGKNRGYSEFGYGDFYELIVDLVETGLYDKRILEFYSKEDIKELEDYIVKERDNLLTYIGITTLATRYCIRGYNKEVLELPQEAFMGVAMFIAIPEKKENRLKWAKMFYDTMSKLEMTEATPTMANARKPNGQLSSCFIGMADDSLESIMYSNDIFSQVSKFGGGMGMYIGKVRALGSDIRGFKGTSGGTVPWIRIMNDTAVACDQLGVRNGAIAITQDIWHLDIEEFFELKTNNGDERRKAHDIFPSISIPDLFMKQIYSKKDRVRDGKFYLFCPHEIRTIKGWSLEDFWGEEFEQKYWECVDDSRILLKKEVNPMDLMKKIAEADGQTGTPFLFFRDTVNRLNPNKHKGMIYCTNLCAEICQNMSVQGEVKRQRITLPDGAIAVADIREAGDLVVCNLATLNVGRVYKKEDIERVVPTIARMLDNVITINTLPVEQATITNERYRAIGLGIGGYHHFLAKNGIKWESEEHLEAADKLTEMINYYAIKASAELAREKGSYLYFEGSDYHNGQYFDLRDYHNENSELDWDWLKGYASGGMRNANIMAVAPNGSSSHYGGYTQSIDPVFGLVYLDSKKKQVIPVVAPELDVIPRWYYKTAHNIDQVWSIKAAAKRQRHIDQSQSFNLYITPETTGEELLKYYGLIWKLGIKTKYYTRNKSDDIDGCESCSA